jgi:hypothetical protein
MLMTGNKPGPAAMAYRLTHRPALIVTQTKTIGRRMMKQLWKPLALGFLLLSLPACNGSGSGDAGATLDSAGKKLKEAGREIGGKIDTAAAGIKTEMDESQMQAALNRFNGL